MSGQHTPGPWKVYRTRDDRVIIGIGDKDGGGITDSGDIANNTMGLWRSGPEREANARLVAAAPELLEACESALMQLRVAVIANSGGLFDHDNVHEHIGIAKIMAAISKATAP
jgi:hypothetical protein